MKEQIKELAAVVENSANTVFFGGAGVSTESGIPDFRSEAGLYAARNEYGYPAEELLSNKTFMREPELFFRYYKENLIYTDALPNAAHRALAEMEKSWNLKAVVTQNVDGLHQAAGSRVVHELHGSNHRQYCVKCLTEYDLSFVLNEANCKDGLIPSCVKCQGMVRPDVVLFGEGLDPDVIHGAIKAIASAEVLIIGGTSLAVYPAAGLLQYFSGDTIVLINKSSTHLDSLAQLVINDSIAKVLEQTIDLLKRQQ